MARGPLAFKERDVTRAVRAVAKAGCSVSRVEVDKQGKIVVIVGEPTPANDNAATPAANEWDDAVI